MRAVFSAIFKQFPVASVELTGLKKMLYRMFTLLCVFFSSTGLAVAEESRSFSFSSALLKENVQVTIALPESYHHSDSFSYPVVYVLDGNTQLGHIRGNLNFLSTYAIVPEFIVVAVNSNNRLLNYTPTEKDDLKGQSGGAEHYLKFFADELIPYVVKHYRAANYKVVTGHSMSGLFVTYAMLHKEPVFNAHFAISPSLWWDNEWIVNQSQTYLKNHSDMSSYLFINLASEPNEMRQAYDRQIAVLNKLAPKGLRWSTNLLMSETHDSTPLISNFHAFKDLFQGWNAVPEIAVMPLAELRTHYRKRAAQYGYDFPLSAHQYNVYGLKATYEGKPEWGIEILHDGVEVFPRSEVLWDGLAEAYEAKGDVKEALICAARALKLAQENNSQWLDAIAVHLNKLQSRQ